MTSEAPSQEAAPQNAAVNAAPEQGVASTEAPTQAPAEEGKGVKQGPAFAALAKKEKALRVQQEAFKAEQAKLAQERAEYEAWKKSKEAAKSNPLAFLEASGLTYDELVQPLIEDHNVSPEVRKVREEVKALKEAQEAQKRAEEEKLRAEAEALEAEKQATVEAYHNECMEFVRSKPDQYELIHANEAFHELPAIVDEFYRVHGKVLSEQEAADLLEKHFEDQLTKLTATKKHQAKARPQPQEDQKQVPKPAPQRTLSNTMSSSQGGPASRQEPDVIKRALAAMEAASQR